MIQQLLQQIEDELVNLDAKASEKQEELERRRQSLTEANQELAVLEETVKKAQQDHQDELAILNEAAEPLRKETQRLKTELSTLVARKGDLMTANATMERRHKELQDYEKKAWATLDAKDKELTAREQTISQKESLNPLKKTFLPPVS